MTIIRFPSRLLRTVIVAATMLEGTVSGYGQSGVPGGMSRSVPSLPEAAPGQAADEPEDKVTVLAIAPDGSWVVATDIWTGRAIATAIRNCKETFGKKIGCS